MPRQRRQKKNTKDNDDRDDVIIDTRVLPKQEKADIAKTVQDSNATAHRILDIAEETNQIGHNAHDKIVQQGEQIDGIAHDVADLNLQVKKNKKTTKGISSFWHAVKNFFTPKCLQPQETEINPVEGRDVVTERDKRRQAKQKDAHETGQTGGSITILFDEHTQRVDKDTFDTLTTVEDVLKDMNATARKTGKELDRQNQVLDQVDELVDEANDDLKETNKRAKKYLKQG